MAATTDFWGEIASAETRTPTSIMSAQAALLGTKTQNLILAHIQTQAGGRYSFVHSFVIDAPTLSYQYVLFRVEHDANLYPVVVSSPDGDKRLETEGEFVDWLRGKLSSPETKKLIGNLLAMVTK